MSAQPISSVLSPVELAWDGRRTSRAQVTLCSVSSSEHSYTPSPIWGISRPSSSYKGKGEQEVSSFAQRPGCDVRLKVPEGYGLTLTVDLKERGAVDMVLIKLQRGW
jgi:hypothetical protein